MPKHHSKLLMLILFSTFLFKYSNAKCILPTADGGGIENVSNRNLAGQLIKINGKTIHVEDYSNHEIMVINVSKINSIYSPYGGDISVLKLMPGMTLRIWFQNCRPAHTMKTTYAAYIEFYSTDLNKIAPSGFFFQEGR